MSAICARLSKGKVGVQRGRKTVGCPSFLPPPWVRRHPPAVGTANPPRRGYGVIPPRRAPRRSRRPQTANPPAEVQRKTLRPERANTLTQFAHPGFPVQKRSRLERANTPAAVRAPRWVGAENPGNPEKIFPPEKAAKTPILTLRKRLSERYS